MVIENTEHSATKRMIIRGGSLLLAAVALLIMVYDLLPGDTAQAAPEAARVLTVQTGLPFQILIPGYLPEGMDRAHVRIQIIRPGAGQAPAVELEYRGPAKTLVVREWKPGQAKQETLIGAAPIDTRWGQGWLRAPSPRDFAAAWVDIGALRVGLYTPPRSRISREELLGILEHMGPAANRQVFTLLKEKPSVRESAPPPPDEAVINAQGIQEIALVVTPSGYSPARFALRKNVPARITFRQLGRVGCGNVLVFPTSPTAPIILELASAQDKQVLDFTPTVAGTFEFHCEDNMYRGILIVRDDPS